MEKQRKFLKRAKKTSKYNKMFLYVVIVNYGLAESLKDTLQENNSNVQFTIVGKGTASKEILRIIGMEDERKDIILAFTDEKNIEYIQKELDTLFLKSKRFMGMGFSLPITSIVGEKVYHFLTNTI